MNIVKALVAAAALSLSGSSAIAKEIKGTPEALIGTFGTSIKECQDNQEQYAFDTPYYRTCANPGCWKRIVSHTPTATGFRLKIRDDGNFKTWPESVTVIDNNTIKWSTVTSATLHRCSALEPLPPKKEEPKKAASQKRKIEIADIPRWIFETEILTAATFLVAKPAPPPRKYERRLYRLHDNNPNLGSRTVPTPMRWHIHYDAMCDHPSRPVYPWVDFECYSHLAGPLYTWVGIEFP